MKTNYLSSGTLSDSEFDAVEQEAVRWFTRINHGDGSPEQTEAFYAWLTRADDHQEKYDAICTLMEGAQEFTDDPLLKDHYRHMLVDVSGSQADTASWQARIAAWWQQSYMPKIVMASLAMVLVLATSQFTNLLRSDQVFETGIGETRVVILEDRSVVRLNTRTKLKVKFDDTQRLITIVQGQANFLVAKDQSKPFIVSSDMGQVIALGTEFDIYKTDKTLQVSLIEGRIQVQHAAAIEGTSETERGLSSVIVETDHELAVSVTVTQSAISPVKKVNPDHVKAWQKGKLIFVDKSLADVVVELNRYSVRPILLKDLGWQSELITAIMPTDVVGALELIKKHFSLIELSGNEGEIILISNKTQDVLKIVQKNYGGL